MIWFQKRFYNSLAFLQDWLPCPGLPCPALPCPLPLPSWAPAPCPLALWPCPAAWPHAPLAPDPVALPCSPCTPLPLLARAWAWWPCPAAPAAPCPLARALWSRPVSSALAPVRYPAARPRFAPNPLPQPCRLPSLRPWHLSPSLGGGARACTHPFPPLFAHVHTSVTVTGGLVLVVVWIGMRPASATRCALHVFACCLLRCSRRRSLFSQSPSRSLRFCCTYT